MSKKEMTVADFRFPYSVLKQLADSTLLLIDRDIVKFADYGFTPAKRAAFETSITEFASFPTDEQLTAVQMELTTAKDSEREALMKQMRTFFLLAKIVFGEKSGAYRAFGNADISRQTD